MNTLMKGKKGLIMGVANDRSIAWGIAQALHNAGAELSFSYSVDLLEKRVRPLAEQVGAKDRTYLCDVTDENAVKTLFANIKDTWGQIDFVVHAIAFSDKNELKGRYIDTTRENFLNTMDISCHSLTTVARYAEPLMNEGGSLLTLSYYGAEKVIPNYNVMGVAKAALEASVRYLAADMGAHTGLRVNAISAGPIKTLAASGIGGFNKILGVNEAMAPLRRNVTQDEVGNAALYLLSPLASGVTGEVHYVDAGVNTVGAFLPE